MTTMQILWWNTPTKTIPSIWQDMHGVQQIGHFHRVCQSRKSRVVNEMEQEVSQEYTEDDLEMVSINSVCFNKICSLLTAKLETFVDNNNMVIPYKIDTGSDGIIMPLYIFKNLFPRVTDSQLAKTITNT